MSFKMSDRKKTIEHIMQEERDSLFRLACYKTGNADDAADIVQDVFLKIWDMDSVSVRDVKRYLYKSVFNACISYKRVRQDVVYTDFDGLDFLEEQPDDGFEEECRRISMLLKMIPPEQAEVISLRTIGGKSFDEIASLLGVNVSTVKSRFRYGIDKIQKKIYSSVI